MYEDTINSDGYVQRVFIQQGVGYSGISDFIMCKVKVFQTIELASKEFISSGHG